MPGLIDYCILDKGSFGWMCKYLSTAFYFVFTSFITQEEYIYFMFFQEYEEQKTKEAKLVKDLDKFDMILQAFEYETDQTRAGTLEEFFKSTEGKFSHPKIKLWVEQLYKEREAKKTKDVNNVK